MYIELKTMSFMCDSSLLTVFHLSPLVFHLLADQACSPLRPPLLQSLLLPPHPEAPPSLPIPAQWRTLHLQQQQLRLDPSAEHLRVRKRWCLCRARRLKGCSTTTSNVRSAKHNSLAKRSWSPTSSRSELRLTQWVLGMSEQYVSCCWFVQLWRSDDDFLFHFPFFSPFSDMYAVLASHDAP